MNVRTLAAAVHFVRNHPVAAEKLLERRSGTGAGGAPPPPAAQPVDTLDQDSGGGYTKTGNQIGFER
jgi:hypothetical protein